MSKIDNQDVAIRVHNIKKDFYLPHEKSSKSLKSIIVNTFKKKNKGADTQHVLRGLSFDIKKGEFFGIVGRNGSGKSTLLKILAQIYQPTSGKVEHFGKLVPFIELGVGFNPELSGRENVYLNGALLGFTREEIAEKYDKIVEFAELEDFMDQKLKNYSSGMQVRLAFSVAIQADADILVLDEVLAVGDEAFQRKCNDYFKQLKDNGKTVILVTHSMENVRKYCNKAMIIRDGRTKLIGSPEDVANEYSLENLELTSSSSARADEHKTGKEYLVTDFKVELLSKKQIDQNDTIEYVSRKITRLSPSDSSRKTIKNILTPEQIEIENLHAENVRLTTELNSFLSTKRSARLLAGNIKRHYARGSIGKLKRAVRVRTRIREVLPVLKNVWNRTYWLLKNIKIRRNVNKIAQEHLTRGNKIPKVIHYIWVGGAKKPESVEKYIATWREHCPDYEIIEWNEQNYNIQLNRYAREAYSAKKWAFVTDYMRLDILDQFGGIYMDSDVEVLKNLDDFLKDSAFSSFEAGDPSQIFMPTGMMASEKGGVWVRYLKSYYSPHKSFFRTNGEIDDTPNTVTITRMTVDKYGVKLNNKLQKFDDFTIYPSEYFCPKSWSTREINITKNTHTIHHFAASWLPPEIRKLQHEGEE